MHRTLLIIAILVVFVTGQWLPVIKDLDSPCYQFKCPFNQRCTVINNQPICLCNHNCARSEKSGPVCTKTGHTYANLCELKKEECVRRDYIIVDYYGNCTKKAKCFDNPREHRMGLCRDWKNRGACKTHVSLMKRFCRESCDLCDVPVAAPSCVRSKYGCCPGTRISALGRRNKGCFKGCRNGITCPFFPNFCGDEENKETMKKHCPFTCRFCIPEGNNRVEIMTEDNL